MNSLIIRGVVRVKLAIPVLLLVVISVSNAAAEGVRSAAGNSGETLYTAKCGLCHAKPFMGYFMLSRRLGEAQADLASRDGVNEDFVKVVVRNGLNGMPHISRGDVSDADLVAIIVFLNRRSGDANRGKSQ